MKFLASIVILSAIFLGLSPLGLGEENIPRRKCLDTTRHKFSPSEEKDLHPVCSHWEGKVCCVRHSTERINQNITDFYHLNQHLCKNSGLSKFCLEFFQMDACLFECSPDIWQYGNIKDNNGDERVKSVPLCESDCNDWFNACAKDMTCSSNWSSSIRKSTKNWDDSGCTKCETIEKKFGTAENFCQSVWDHSYTVVKDGAECMSLRGNNDDEPDATPSVLPNSPKSPNFLTPRDSSTEDHQNIPEMKGSETNEDDGKSSSDSIFIYKSSWSIFTILFGLFYSFLNVF